MIYSTVPNKIFKHSTSDLYTISGGLINRQKVSPDDVEKIKSLHCIRFYFYDLIELSTDKAEIRRFAKIITQVEFQLQKLWKFNQNEDYHRWFEIPKCSCPKIDNSDYLGSGYRVVNPDCIVHGN